LLNQPSRDVPDAQLGHGVRAAFRSIDRADNRTCA
jgi:hypothetical protein